MKIQVLAQKGSKPGSVEIGIKPDDLEALNVPLLHELVLMQRAGIRAGTASTKTRGEVSGGGKKPYRQKGTGRARQGSTRAPQWRGGAIIFGPRPRDYYYRQPSKKMVLGIRHSLWSHLKNNTFHVAESLAVPSRKTKEIVALLKQWNFQPGMERILLIDAGLTEEMYYSYRNIPGLEILLPHQINPYDLILADKLVVSQAAFPLISRFLEGGGDGSL
jgi:large subunit ribosomal protein L4